MRWGEQRAWRTGAVLLAVSLAILPGAGAHVQGENTIQQPEGLLQGEDFLVHTENCEYGEDVEVRHDGNAAGGFYAFLPREACPVTYGLNALGNEPSAWTKARVRIPHDIAQWEICYELKVRHQGVLAARADFCDEGRHGWFLVPFQTSEPLALGLQEVDVSYTIDDERTLAPDWCDTGCNLHLDLLAFEDRPLRLPYE